MHRNPMMKQGLRVAGAVVMLAVAGTACAGVQGGARSGGDGGAIVLFDGTSTDGWRQIGPRGFTLENGALVSHGGMGLFYYAERPFRDFVLELEYRTISPGANSGIYIRFPEQTDDPLVPVSTGYEIQINDLRDPMEQTGSVSTFSPAVQLASKPAGERNRYRIEVRGQRYDTYLNGQKVSDFIGNRAREGYIGLQNYDDDSKIWYRNVRV